MIKLGGSQELLCRRLQLAPRGTDLLQEGSRPASGGLLGIRESGIGGPSDSPRLEGSPFRLPQHRVASGGLPWYRLTNSGVGGLCSRLSCSSGTSTPNSPASGGRMRPGGPPKYRAASGGYATARAAAGHASAPLFKRVAFNLESKSLFETEFWFWAVYAMGFVAQQESAADISHLCTQHMLSAPLPY